MEFPVKHGQNDLCQIDTSYKPTFWQDKLPLGTEDSAIAYYRANTPARGTKSLRQTSAEVAARNCNILSSEVLNKCPWFGVCEVVWKYMCLMGLDSFTEFIKFAENFSLNNGFLCHHIMQPDETRSKYLESYLLRRSQRTEFIPAQLSTQALVSNLNELSFDNLVLLDFNNVYLSSQSCLDLMGLKNLQGLDVSTSNEQHKLPDNILRSWCIATKNQWKNLHILLLGGRIQHTTTSIFQSLFHNHNNHLIYLEGPELSPADIGNNWTVGAGTQQRIKNAHRGNLTEIYFRLKNMDEYDWREKLFKSKRRRTITLDLISSSTEGLWSRKSNKPRKPNNVSTYVRIYSGEGDGDNDNTKLSKRKSQSLTLKPGRKKPKKTLSHALEQFL